MQEAKEEFLILNLNSLFDNDDDNPLLELRPTVENQNLSSQSSPLKVDFTGPHLDEIDLFLLRQIQAGKLGVEYLFFLINDQTLPITVLSELDQDCPYSLASLSLNYGKIEYWQTHYQDFRPDRSLDIDSGNLIFFIKKLGLDFWVQYVTVTNQICNPSLLKYVPSFPVDPLTFILQHPCLNRPQAWLCSEFLLHIPLEHSCFDEEKNNQWLEHILYYILGQAPQTAHEPWLQQYGFDVYEVLTACLQFIPDQSPQEKSPRQIWPSPYYAHVPEEAGPLLLRFVWFLPCYPMIQDSTDEDSYRDVLKFLTAIIENEGVPSLPAQNYRSYWQPLLPALTQLAQTEGYTLAWTLLEVWYSNAKLVNFCLLISPGCHFYFQLLQNYYMKVTIDTLTVDEDQAAAAAEVLFRVNNPFPLDLRRLAWRYLWVHRQLNSEITQAIALSNNTAMDCQTDLKEDVKLPPCPPVNLNPDDQLSPHILIFNRETGFTCLSRADCQVHQRCNHYYTFIIQGEMGRGASVLDECLRSLLVATHRYEILVPWADGHYCLTTRPFISFDEPLLVTNLVHDLGFLVGYMVRVGQLLPFRLARDLWHFSFQVAGDHNFSDQMAKHEQLTSHYTDDQIRDLVGGAEGETRHQMLQNYSLPDADLRRAWLKGFRAGQGFDIVVTLSLPWNDLLTAQPSFDPNMFDVASDPARGSAFLDWWINKIDPYPKKRSLLLEFITAKSRYPLLALGEPPIRVTWHSEVTLPTAANCHHSLQLPLNNSDFNAVFAPIFKFPTIYGFT